MRKILLSLSLIIISLITNGQTNTPPQAFKYQAVVRDNAGNPMGGIPVGFQVTIKSISCTGSPVYQEEFLANTNTYGLVNLSIGRGNNFTGDFNLINWGQNAHFIDISIDINGGNNYSPMTCTEMLSVPYALYASQSGGGPPGPQGVQGPATLLLSTILNPGNAQCSSGGIMIESGIDSNANNLLDLNEVLDTIGYVCNGDPSTDNQQILLFDYDSLSQNITLSLEMVVHKIFNYLHLD